MDALNHKFARCEHCTDLVPALYAIGTTRVCAACITIAARSIQETALDTQRLANHAANLSQSLFDLSTEVYRVIDADVATSTTNDIDLAPVNDRLVGAYQALTNAARQAQEARAHLLRYYNGPVAPIVAKVPQQQRTEDELEDTTEEYR